MGKKIVKRVKMAEKSKNSLTTSQIKSKRHNKSIRSTIEEGQAYIERLKQINKKNKKQERREIIKQPLQIKKKIHNLKKVPQGSLENKRKNKSKQIKINIKNQNQKPKNEIVSLVTQDKKLIPQNIKTLSQANLIEKNQTIKQKKPIQKQQSQQVQNNLQNDNEKHVQKKDQKIFSNRVVTLNLLTAINQIIQPIPEKTNKAQTQAQAQDKKNEFKKPVVKKQKVLAQKQPSKKVLKQQKARKLGKTYFALSENPSLPNLKEPPATPEIENQENPQKKMILNEVKQEDQKIEQFQDDISGIKQEILATAPQISDKIEQIDTKPRLTETQQSRSTGKPAAGIIDVVFVVDTTGSMNAYLQKTKDCVLLLVDRIKTKTLEHDISVRFGFIAYRDHPPQENTYVTLNQDLCPAEEILQFIEGLDCSGGGDGAEAVLDGLNEAATKISWRKSLQTPSLRYIFHIGDQPPHGREYGGYSEFWDDGCICGLTLDQIAHNINIREIHYRLIKASATKLELMSELFKSKFSNYEDTILELVQGEASEMDIRISDMVIRELLPDYDYNDA